jgi:hypothetical protein
MLRIQKPTVEEKDIIAEALLIYIKQCRRNEYSLVYQGLSEAGVPDETIIFRYIGVTENVKDVTKNLLRFEKSNLQGINSGSNLNSYEKESFKRERNINKACRENFVQELPIERYAEVDIVFPANEEEYFALGGNAVAMIIASSEHQSELPLVRAYFQEEDGKEIILTKIIFNSDVDIFAGDKITKGKFANDEKECFTNLSFWLIPISLFRDDKGIIMVDFKGERKAFAIRRGPWQIDKQNQEYMQKQSQGDIKVTENQQDSVIAKIIEREFINPRLSNKVD